MRNHFVPPNSAEPVATDSESTLVAINLADKVKPEEIVKALNAHLKKVKN